MDFLNGHKQFVRSGDSVSNTTIVGAGTPQCTVSGPNDFKLVINDLTFNTCYVKYVDDTTVPSISKIVNDNTLQTSADHLVHWTQNNGMMINTNYRKCTLWRCKSTPTPKAKLLWMTSHYGPTVVRSVTEIPFHVFI